MWIALGVAAIVITGVVVWWFCRDPLGGSGLDDQFRVERKWGWELLLDEQSEAAFMAGLKAFYDAGTSLYFNGERGTLSMSQPPRLISMFLLAERFRAQGPQALADPVGAVRYVMTQCISTEQPGVLHLRENWLAGQVDGMDKYRFLEVVRTVTCPPGAPGIDTWFGDENSGRLDVTVLGGRPDSVAAAEHEMSSHITGGPIMSMPGLAKELVKDQFRDNSPYLEAHGRYEGEKSRYTNTLVIDLARVLDHYRAARTQHPQAPVEAVLRDVIVQLISSGGSATTWMRPPTDQQRQIVLAALRTG